MCRLRTCGVPYRCRSVRGRVRMRACVYARACVWCVCAPARSRGVWIRPHVHISCGVSVCARVRYLRCLCPQAIRREHDRRYSSWMPHINLLFPLSCPDDQVASIESRIAAIVGAAKPFSVTLESVDVFQHPLGYETPMERGIFTPM